MTQLSDKSILHRPDEAAREQLWTAWLEAFGGDQVALALADLGAG